MTPPARLQRALYAAAGDPGFGAAAAATGSPAIAAGAGGPARRVPPERGQNHPGGQRVVLAPEQAGVDGLVSETIEPFHPRTVDP